MTGNVLFDLVLVAIAIAVLSSLWRLIIAWFDQPR
jgi:hypothetical protein